MLVAFANTAGGDLYIGVDNDGRPVGVDCPERIIRNIATAARRICPSMIGCISAEVLRENEIAVVHVHVTAGNLRPYSMIPDRPEGVYVRTESASVPASLADIARIVRDTPITPFEAQPSAVQTLSFNAMNAFCAQAGVIIPPKRELRYGLWSGTLGCWTNLALLCSDQSSTELILTEFADDAMHTVVRTLKIKGSIFKALRA